MPLLKSINQNPETGFQLIPKTNHTTPQNGPLMITIKGEIYEVIFEEGCFSSTSQLTHASIQVLFDNGKLYSIRCREQWRFNIKSSQLKQLLGFICFDNIRRIQFSIIHFPPDFFCVRLGIPYDNTTPNFGIGCLKVKAVIDIFKKRIQSEFRKINIQQLWFEFVHFLVRIGYFNIFNYNDFRSFSFLFFLKMFPFGNHVRKENRFNMFYSFVEYLMMGNRCFIIHGQNIRPVRGNLHSGLVQLFSERIDNVVNFVDDKTRCVGMTAIRSPDHMSTCHIVSLKTMKVRDIGPLFDLKTHYRIEYDIMKVLTGNHPDPDSDSDFSSPFPLQRNPACRTDVSLIKNGFFEFHGNNFIIFKTFYSNRPIIQCFLQIENETFEIFPSFFLTLLHLFCPDNRFFQLDDHFDGSIDGLVNAIVQCGFEPVFDGTATSAELHYLLMESQFGILLQILRSEYETHKDSLRRSIRETTHFKSFKRVLEMIFRLLIERKNSELSPEIHELIQFMDLLIQL